MIDAMVLVVVILFKVYFFFVVLVSMSFLVLLCLVVFFFCHLGGEEWKIVADGLGLTPREIRFLDQRTLNPMEAVLGFVGQKSSVRVETLYDLMTELGLPEAADLL